MQTNIVKNKLKVEASIVNARLFVELLDEFCPDHSALDDQEGFWTFLEQYKKTPARVLESRATPGYKTSSVESDRLSADLKKRGFKFVGKERIYGGEKKKEKKKIVSLEIGSRRDNVYTNASACYATFWA